MRRLSTFPEKPKDPTMNVTVFWRLYTPSGKASKYWVSVYLSAGLPYETYIKDYEALFAKQFSSLFDRGYTLGEPAIYQ